MLKSLSHGPKPEVSQCDGLEAAIERAVAILKAWRDIDAMLLAEGGSNARTVAVLVRTAVARNAIEQRCKAEGMKIKLIDKGSEIVFRLECVGFATLHRAKGLAFDRVVIVGRASAFGPREETAQERRLLSVAMTRAKREAPLVLY